MSHAISRIRIEAIVNAAINAALTGGCTSGGTATAATVLRGCDGLGYTVPIHSAAVLTNNAAPFAWNTGSQTGNVPAVTVSSAGNTLTITIGGVAFNYTPAVPLDAFVASGAYNPATNLLTLTLNNGSTVDIDMTTLLSDALGTLLKCDGTPFATATDRIVTCAALPGLFSGFTAGVQGVLGGAGNANTYVGADGQLHLLPAAPVVPVAATNLPLADAVTTGSAGVSPDFARYDHVHPFTHSQQWSQAAGLQYTHNSDTLTWPIVPGLVTNIIGYDSTGVPTYQSLASALSTLVAAGSATPNADALAGSPGASTAYAREDHVHPFTQSLAINQTSGFTYTHNGQAVNVPVNAGTISEVFGFDAGGNPIRQTITALTPSAATAAPVSDAAIAVVGVSTAYARADHVHPFTQALALTQAGGLVYTHNGLAATVAIPAGAISQAIGFDATGNPVRGTAASPLATVAPPADAITTGAVGTSTNVAREDHIHPFTHSLASAINTLTYTHNGDALTAAIINSNLLALTQAGGLVSTVNGVAATVAIPAGTISQVLGFDVGGNPVRGTITVPVGANAILADSLTGAGGIALTFARSDHQHAFSHSLASAVNTLTYTHNGNALTAAIINSNTQGWTKAAGLTQVINGVAAAAIIPAAGIIADVLGYDAAGAVVFQSYALPAAATIAPSADALTTGAVGVSANYARQDHVHPFTHALAWTQAGGLVYTHNGDAQTIAIPVGTLVEAIGYDATGSPVRSNSSIADFWRSGAGGTTLPDNATDTTEDIRRDGKVGIGNDPRGLLHVEGPNGDFSTNDVLLRLVDTTSGNELAVDSGSVPGLGATRLISLFGGLELQASTESYQVYLDPNVGGKVGFGTSLPVARIDNTGSTVLRLIPVANLPVGGSIGASTATVDVFSGAVLAQTTAGQAITLPNPTSPVAGRVFNVTHDGTASVTVQGKAIAPGETLGFVWDGNSWNAPAVSPLAAIAPPADTITTGAAGVSTNVARQDHTHPFTHALALTQAGGLVYTHNGNAQTVAIPAGTISQVLGFDVGGNPVRGTITVPVGANAILADSLTGAGGTALTFARSDHQHAFSHSLASAVNTLTYTHNGNALTAAIINSNALALTQAGGLVSTVNGIAATQAIPAGTIVQQIGFDATGAPVRSGTSVADFWRSGAGATTLPDGTTDLTENIRRNGNVGLNTDPVATLDNNGSTVLRAVAIADRAASGALGTAATTVDIASGATINQVTPSITISLPNPTDTTVGRIFYVHNIGTAQATVSGVPLAPDALGWFVWDGNTWNTISAQATYPTFAVTGSATINPDSVETLFIANTAAATITLATPTAGVSARRFFYIKRTVSNAFPVTLTPASGQIEGGASYVFNGPLESLKVQYDGTNWWVL